MSRPSPFDPLLERIEFDPEEPGTFIVLLLVVVFIALTPKTGCSFHDAPATEPPAAEATAP